MKKIHKMSFLKIKKNKSFGFSLLELILAIAIFSLGSYAMATMLIDSNISTRFDTERIEALSYAKEGIEAVRSIRDASSTAWSALEDGPRGLSDSGDLWSFSGTSELIDDKYTRTVSIASTTVDSTKTVSVTVGWDLTPVRPVSVVLDTIFTNWISVVNTVATSTGGTQISIGGLISYWSFDDAGSGTALDSVGDNDGIMNGATATTGIKSLPSTAYSFNGTSDYINSTYQPTFIKDVNNFSISLWFKKDRSGVYEYILGVGDIFPTLNFRLDPAGYITINFGTDGKSSVNYITDYTDYNDDNWHQIVFTRGEDTGSHAHVLYVDGVLVGNEWYQSNCNTDMTFTVPFYFGNRDSSGGAPSNYFFQGALDEIRVFDHALTSEEVGTLYSEESP